MPDRLRQFIALFLFEISNIEASRAVVVATSVAFTAKQTTEVVTTGINDWPQM